MRNLRRFAALLLVAAALTAAAGCEAVQEMLPGSPGEKLYRKLCADCHGIDGRGNTPRYMGNNAADLMDDNWERGGDRGSIEITIRQGIFGDMPAHPELTAEEMKQLIDHLFALRGESTSN